MSILTTSKKILQSFHARESLWTDFENQAKVMDCSVDYLINEAMRAYAAQNGFLETSKDEEILDGDDFLDAIEDVDEVSEVSQVSVVEEVDDFEAADDLIVAEEALPALDDSDDFDSIEEEDDDELSGLTFQDDDDTIPPPKPTETAPTLANPSGRIQPAKPIATSSLPSAPAAQAPAAPKAVRAPAPPTPTGPSGRVPAVPSAPGVNAPAAQAQAPAPPAAEPSVPQEPSRPVLTLIYKGRKVLVKKDQFIIGRGAKSADMPIKDPNISRKHAAIIFHNGAYYIKDLGSTNGVEYGDKLVDSKRIDEGDVFTICGHALHFTYS